jgi:predicted nucleic acid binding AN1-type Zn finger protein
MEFSDLGEHCKAEGCNMKDFLPFKCKFCKMNFCLDHRTFEAHHCSANKEMQCVSISSSREETPQKQNKARNNLRCDHSKCKAKDIVHFDCRNCGRKFCLNHRSQMKHKCPSLERCQHSGRTGLARNLGHSRLVQAVA